MNKTVMVGYATMNATLSETSTGVKVSRFNIAVKRAYTSQDGERKTDFFPVVCWRGLAENVARYVHKGSRVCVCGSFESRTYDDSNGDKIAVIELIAQDVEFLDNRKSGEQSDNQTGGGQERNGKQSFQSIVDELADTMGDYPF